MFAHAWQYFQQFLHFCFVYCFYNVFVVLSEKEKTSTYTSICFFCIFVFLLWPELFFVRCGPQETWTKINKESKTAQHSCKRWCSSGEDGTIVTEDDLACSSSCSSSCSFSCFFYFPSRFCASTPCSPFRSLSRSHPCFPSCSSSSSGIRDIDMGRLFASSSTL